MNLSPDSEAEAESERQVPSTVASPRTRGWIPRSCFACNNKKIRCDKKEPCSACTRAERQCAYPPMGPRKRRTKITIMSEMAARISDLEKSLAEARKDGSVAGDEQRQPHADANESAIERSQADPSPSALSEEAQGIVLVQKGSSSQYFNEVLLSRVIAEEEHIESILTPPRSEKNQPSLSSPFNAAGILSAPSVSLPPASLHPTQELALKLWHIYVANVDGCSGLKMLHVPTDELRMYSTIDNPSLALLENLALAFAIYFAAAVTVEASEARSVLGHDKETFLLRCKIGLEQSFAYSDFLDRPTITGLHALAVYLTALRVQNHGKGIWVLNGLATRIAESLGLHRDGDSLGISPFQAEIRRRVWWHLITRDGRAGEDYGLECKASLLHHTAVKLPSNLDDMDITQNMTTLPNSKPGYTSMTFSLINIELTQAMQKIANLATSSSSPPVESARLAIIEELQNRIDRRLEHCNPVVPQHRLAIFCSRFLLRKLNFVSRLQWIVLRGPVLHNEFATEANLVEALAVVEPRLHGEDGMLKQFAWARKMYPQYHVAMYILWHLCVKPEGPNVERAWDAVNILFAAELWDESSIGFGSKSAVLAALRSKAIAIRQQLHHHTELNPAPISTLDSSVGANDIEPSLGGVADGSLDLGSDVSEWPEWEALIRGFQFDTQQSLFDG
ncbi:hypothetical protein BDV96DRAFT_508566 [Lophiotrema nucula]|uniref:Zn(2)-C6 fungal-type domain-containing protein n=1 Tax=Lophiotrema nucula TaxID=690887 RepID=A0A6A5YI49_9PLEO|nr:hypothetical protein BDV96DRAFT_508566 [Lophiotrema nucula]